MVNVDYREVAEENRILEIRTGSHLFGTNTPDSDLDYVGVFMPCKEMLFGLRQCEEVDLGTKSKDDTGRNTKDAVDRKLHNYQKFVRLAIQNNPNILNILFANDPNIVFEDEGGYGRRLLDMAPKFPSKAAHHRFVAYADSQRHKMRIKPQNYAALEKGLTILEAEDDNKVIAELRDIAPFKNEGKGKHIMLGDLNFEAGVYVKKARRMVKERLSKATNRHILFTKYGYDVKFAANLIQLLLEGIELMQTGFVKMPLIHANTILDIKAGKYDVEYILYLADKLVDDARSHSRNRAYRRSLP